MAIVTRRALILDFSNDTYTGPPPPPPPTSPRASSARRSARARLPDAAGRDECGGRGGGRSGPRPVDEYEWPVAVWPEGLSPFLEEAGGLADMPRIPNEEYGPARPKVDARPRTAAMAVLAAGGGLIASGTRVWVGGWGGGGGCVGGGGGSRQVRGGAGVHGLERVPPPRRCSGPGKLARRRVAQRGPGCCPPTPPPPGLSLQTRYIITVRGLRSLAGVRVARWGATARPSRLCASESALRACRKKRVGHEGGARLAHTRAHTP